MFSYLWSDNSYVEDLPSFSSSFVVSDVIPVVWMEHCMECAMPLCYHSCDMFVDRGDGRCRRFVNGTSMYVSDKFHTMGATVDFKRWAKLQASIRTRKTVPVNKVINKERQFNKVAGVIEKFCRFVSWKWHRPSRMIESCFDRWYIPCIMSANVGKVDTCGLLITVYNHEAKDRTIHFELKNVKQVVYHRSLLLRHGWNEFLLDCVVPDDNYEYIALIYMDNDEMAKLTFQTLDFVIATQKTAKSHAEKVKCVAWDLDNTMWTGVIGDDGADGVIPNPDSLSLVRELDKMGILQTIVSKNEYDIAWNKLTDMGIAEFFLYPAINWGRKSQNLISIAKELNINIDTFAVIDDSEFERNEISSALPQVRVLDIKDIKSILNKPEFAIPVTDESKHRRQSYITESHRKAILASWSGNYNEFLRDCEIKLELFTPVEVEEQKRCLELIHRSNQYNITKNRRGTDYIPTIIKDNNYKIYAFRVFDKFGSYGIVGFSSFEIMNDNWYLRDFVMSCRVAQKTIEKSFFEYIATKLGKNHSVFINVEKTDRNLPIRRELSNLSVKVLKDDDSILSLQLYSNVKAISNIIKIVQC